MPSRQIKIAVSLVLMLVAATLLASRWYFPTPKIEARPHLGIGEALAERVIQLGGKGRIALMVPDTSEGKFPGAAIQLKAFHAALRRANLALALTNVVRIDPNRVLRAPPGDFADLLKKFADADVVVSLLGPPVLSGDQKARMGEKHPKVIAVCTGDLPKQVNLKAIFAEQLLHAAIISRPGVGLTTPTSENAADWFQHYFLWVTPQNLADLPEGGVK
jgi:hypothetical protein